MCLFSSYIPGIVEIKWIWYNLILYLLKHINLLHESPVETILHVLTLLIFTVNFKEHAVTVKLNFTDGKTELKGILGISQGHVADT